MKEAISLPLEDKGVEARLVDQVMKECDRAGVDRGVGLKVLNALVAEGKRVQGIPLEQDTETPISMIEKAMKLHKEGKKLIRMDVGEPDFRPPGAVLEACSEALFSFKTHYTLPKGIPELVSAIRNYLQRKRSFEAKESELLVTPSGRFAVYAAFASVLREGESAIIIEPNWPAYKQILNYVSVKPITVPTKLDESWDVNLDDVKNAIRSNTKAMVLSYPCNPTGKVVDPSFFRELLGVANDNGLTVISDEIYNEYSYKPCPTVLAGGAESFVVTSSFSKTWAMTGFRIGYAVSSAELVSRMTKIVSLVVTCVPEFIQYGAIKALESDRESEENSKTMKERIELVDRELSSIDSLSYTKPDGGMYFFPELTGRVLEAKEFGSRLLNEKGVTVTSGTAFGDYPHNFRISLGQPQEVLVEGVRKIGELLD